MRGQDRARGCEQDQVLGNGPGACWVQGWTEPGSCRAGWSLVSAVGSVAPNGNLFTVTGRSGNGQEPRGGRLSPRASRERSPILLQPFFCMGMAKGQWHS